MTPPPPIEDLIPSLVLRPLSCFHQDKAGKLTPLSKYRGKVLLIVNVASSCGISPVNYTVTPPPLPPSIPQGSPIARAAPGET